MNIVMALMLARVFPAHELGLFKLFFLYLSLCPTLFLVCGVNLGFSYWAGQAERGRAMIRMAALMILIQAAVAFILIALFRIRIASLLDWPQALVVPFAFSVFSVVAANFYEDSIVAVGGIWRGATFSSFFELLRTGAILITALMTRSLVAVLIAHSAVQLIRIAIGYWLGRQYGLFKLKWNREAFLEVLRYGIPVSGSFLVGIGLNYSDQLILSRWINPAQFAFYSNGCLTIPPLTILQASMVAVLVPGLAKAFNHGDTKEAARAHRRFVAELSFFVIPSAVGLAIFASPILRLLFTERYSGAAVFLRYYAVWYLGLIIAPDVIPRARGEARWILKFSTIFSLLTVALCAALTFQGGAIGALIGLLLARTFARIYALVYIRETCPWAWMDFLPGRFVLKILALCSALAIAALWSRIYLGDSFRWFAIAGSGFAAVYFVVATGWWRTEREDTSMEPRKVLMLSQHLAIGGLERMILSLSSTLKNGGKWIPEVLAYDHSDEHFKDVSLVSVFQSRGIRVTRFSKPPGFSLRIVVKILIHCVRNRIGVIHSHDLGALIYAVSVRLISLGSIRVVHTQHSFIHLSRNSKYALYERFFTRFVTHLAVVSPDTRRIYQSIGIHKPKIHVVPNGVSFGRSVGSRTQKTRERQKLLDAGLLPATLGKNVEDFWILYLARIHSKKGQNHALALWDSLKPEFRERCSLIFVGPCTDEPFGLELQKRISASPDSNRVFRTGPTRSPESWIEISDVYLSCSEFEGLPLGPIEAMSSGLPTLLSDIPGHEIFRDTAWLYPTEHPVSGALKLERILSSATHRHPSPSSIPPSLKNQFSVETMADRYMELYA